MIEGGDRGDYTVYFKAGGQGIDEVESGKRKGEKFVENGQLYIRVGDKTYDVMGQIIK